MNSDALVFDNFFSITMNLGRNVYYPSLNKQRCTTLITKLELLQFGNYILFIMENVQYLKAT